MTNNTTNYHLGYRVTNYQNHDHKYNLSRMRGLKRKAESQSTGYNPSKDHNPHTENRMESVYQLGSIFWKWCKTVVVKGVFSESTDSVRPPSLANWKNPRSELTKNNSDVSQKRRKITRNDISLRNSKSMSNLSIKGDFALVDISQCDKEKARQEIDKFWEPKPLPWMGQSLTSEWQSQNLETQLREEEPKGSQVASRRFSDSDSVAFKYKYDSHSGNPYSEKDQYHRHLLAERYQSTAHLEKSLKNLLLDTSDSLVLSEYKVAQNLAQAKEKERKERQDKIDRARQRRLCRCYPHQRLIQSLEPNWEEKIIRAHSSRGDDVLSTSIGGTELRNKDFRTLLDYRAWLNDEIINAFIEWIVDAANKAAETENFSLGIKSSSTPKFIAHNSFFYETLRKRGPASLDRLMKRKGAPGTLLLGVDSIFIPICSGAHWTLGVVRPVARTIEYFDSMGGNPSIFISHMQNWLKHQLGEAYSASEWTTPPTKCTYQTNGYDCGVFLCTNAFCVAVGLDTCCYDEVDMTTQRRNIAAILLNRGFRGEFSWKVRENGLTY